VADQGGVALVSFQSVKRLRWHYRSRRESLITFSNRFVYDNELITFPSVLDIEGSSAVTHHFVSNGRWVPNKSGGGFNPVEAEELVKLIVQQLEQEPDKSLGVITFNQAQQMEVLEKLNGLRTNRPDLAELLSEGRDEPIFVKNIETVQGDERDVIILGVTYGLNTANKPSMNFGPLNKQGGERRLNVAITRARYTRKLFRSRTVHLLTPFHPTTARARNKGLKSLFFSKLPTIRPVVQCMPTLTLCLRM
jgi:superfamily I DNA and/or RNA helicase